MHCPAGTPHFQVCVWVSMQETERDICDAWCCMFNSCKHICSLCTRELMLNSIYSLLNSLYYICFFTTPQQFFSSPMSASQILLSVPLAPQGILHASHQSPSGCRSLRHQSMALPPWTIFWSDFSLRKGFLLDNRKETKLVSFLILIQKPLLEMRKTKCYLSLALLCLAILPSTSRYQSELVSSLVGSWGTLLSSIISRSAEIC